MGNDDLRARTGSGGASRASTEETLLDDLAKRGLERDIIVCARCEHRLTDASARIEINGRHEHSCTNPGGYRFTFGCYFAAPGCAQSGNPSMERSWFAGYSWQLDNCGSCQCHLGWLFRGDEHSFHGLIVDRIAIIGQRTDS